MPKTELLRPDSGRRAGNALLAAQPPRRAKQVLNVVGESTLIQATVERLSPVIPPERLWVLTNDHLRPEIVRQLPADSQAADSGRARAAEYGAGDRPGGAHSAIDRSGFGHGRVPVRSRDCQAAPIFAIRALGVRRGGARARSWCWEFSRGGRIPATATSSFPASVKSGIARAGAGVALPREAQCRDGTIAS